MVQVEARRGELSRFLDLCERQKAGTEARNAARICAQNLHDSGKAYGFPQISETALALEEALENSADAKTLASLTRAVINACTEILQIFPENSFSRRVPFLSVLSAPLQNISNKPLLLIADDDPAVSEMLKHLFSREADVVLAGNGKEALDMILDKMPALVILDDVMPELTGIDVLNALAQKKDIRVPRIIMLTARNNADDVTHGISLGVLDYVTKPFDPARLAVHVRRILRHIKIKILVADDDEAVRDLLLYKLRKLGFEVLVAHDGVQAFKTARDETPQLLILDRAMPGMDGLAVLRSVREDPVLQKTPVIFLTAKRQNNEVIEGFEIGATDYIVKPFTPDAVVSRVMRGLGLQEAV